MAPKYIRPVQLFDQGLSYAVHDKRHAIHERFIESFFSSRQLNGPQFRVGRQPFWPSPECRCTGASRGKTKQPYFRIWLFNKSLKPSTSSCCHHFLRKLAPFISVFILNSARSELIKYVFQIYSNYLQLPKYRFQPIFRIETCQPEKFTHRLQL
jgi:hypothetical protein